MRAPVRGVLGMFLPRYFGILSTQSGMQRSCFGVWVVVGFLSAMGVCRAQRSQAAFGFNLDGSRVTRLANSDTQAIVLFFTATDCPISNRYIPEIQSIENEFAAQHVMFWYVYPNVGETAAAVRRHEREFGAEGHVLFDPDHRLVSLAHAHVTPEAAVLVAGPDGAALHVLYHGRIDNRYIQIGQQRPSATQHDLERAIEDVLQHRPVQQPDGPPVGCGIIGRQ